MIQYTTEVLTGSTVPCPDGVHVADAWATMTDKRYQKCPTCHGTANDPKEVEETLAVAFTLTEHGALEIPGVGKLIARDAQKLATLVNTFKG